MINKIKSAILLLVPLLFLQSIWGQQPVNMTDHLRQKFSEYCKSVPREEIYMHTDRDVFISGEDLWFNIYLLDRQSLKPSSESKIVYFELLNFENRPVIQKRILIDRGIGPGLILLPDTLSSGTYTIRAYTSWMKNFLPYDCFMKDISVYNTLNNTAFKRKLNSGNFIRKDEINNPAQMYSDGVNMEVNNSKQDSLEIIINHE